MNKLALLIALPTMASSPPAEAQLTVSGAELHDACESAGRGAECEAFIKGATDMLLGLDAFRSAGRFCVPRSVVDFRQTTEIVRTYLRENSQRRHHPAHALVYDALARAFKCRKA